jgi:DNA-binding transcriptional regulator YiaG
VKREITRKPLLERIKDRCEVDEDGCWVWKQGLNPEGYPVMHIAEINPVSPVYVRRIAYVLEIGPLHARRRVASTCEKKNCCNPEHLFAATEAELARTQYRIDRASRGERHSVAQKTAKRSWKLTYEKAQEIRRLRSEGMKREEVARMFDVNVSLVSEITANKIWVRGNPFVI